MRTVNIVEGKRHLGELISRVAYGGERVILTRKSKPVAALVSMEDLARLEAKVSPRFSELAGMLSHEAAEAMKRAILEECERIDVTAW